MGKLFNCNLPQLNPCEYDLDRNEGEKSLRPTMLSAGIKISPDETLQKTRYKCASSQCKTNKCSCVRAGIKCSVFCHCQQCYNQSDMHMDGNEIEDENNDSESDREDE